MREWIKVSERLPERKRWVLWLDGNKTMHAPFVHIDYINDRNEACVNYLHNYTHWMPLPAPPEAE